MQDGAVVVLAVIALVAVVGIAFALQFYCHDRPINPDDLRVPLITSRANNRAQLVLNDANEGFHRCSVCAFENFKRAQFCSLCGAQIDTREGVQASSYVDLLHSSAANTRVAYTSRQLRARNRNEWLRKVDAHGRLYWHRNRREHNVGAPRLAGYVLTFIEPTTESYVDAIAITMLSSTPVAPSALDLATNDAREPTAAAPTPTPVPLVVCTVFPPERDATAPTTEPPSVNAEHGVQQPVLRSKDAVAAQLSLQTSSAQHLLTGSWDADPAQCAIPQRQPRNVSDALALATHDFPTKLAHFVVTTTSLLVPPEREVVALSIQRHNLLNDSIEALSRIPHAHIRASFRVSFVDERGVDAGGIYREWSGLLYQQLADAASGVFTCVDPIDQTFYLNAHSLCAIGDDHLVHFFATGRLVGRALLEGQTLGFHLALPLLKLLLGQPVSFNDLEYFDKQAYTSMLWILAHDGVDDLGLTFSVAEQRSGANGIVEVDLIEDGRNVGVTDDNKELYLQRRFQYLLFESVSTQLYAFLKGVYEVVPQELLMLFDPEELDFVLSGSDAIDVTDWQRSTRYSGGLDGTHQIVRWFWDIVRTMPNEFRRRLLFFATGSSRVPLGGFSALTSVDGRLFRFTLHGVALDENEYIASHACFNQLDVPLYHSCAKLSEVLYAVLEVDVLDGGFTTE